MSTQPGGRIAMDAPAKVNLYLHVVGRRSDGYHLLDTLMVFTALGDRVEVAPSDTLSLTSDGPFADRLPADADDNLVLRAARALAEAAGVEPKAQIRLTKNLPVSAGLGSGSSDAAATLKALARLWGIPDGAVDLPALALTLGADVPACLRAESVFVGGIGEALTPTPRLPKTDILLVNPGVQLVTGSVFEARRGGFNPEARFKKSPENVRALAELLEDRCNDLSDAATRLLPVVSEMLRTIEASPGCRLARMSGSGATCFGLFDDADTAKRAREALRARDWWCAVTQFGG
ncbi:MAG: 4-(cytidine 5'-diphospho)-2-C-methyl-D-erythritol kinase [Gammaproteobacteria bacterium]|jgi:4-diphosphocytidyl-2-C-methyl-D-erythritol kinase